MCVSLLNTGEDAVVNIYSDATYKPVVDLSSFVVVLASLTSSLWVSNTAFVSVWR